MYTWKACISSSCLIGPLGVWERTETRTGYQPGNWEWYVVVLDVPVNYLFGGMNATGAGVRELRWYCTAGLVFVSLVGEAGSGVWGLSVLLSAVPC
ncbi:hypothetical protein BU24DRAFT_425255 [Aaosphaeria arxii CBS 175.79]|uniref:Uncharacterized protein n=1 Tax=Aaosphaeria arxii CBS 175.79 TaxID=1450172 RepID=A0A6A5XIL0_9PLEO|nr:uncharacterized protein BU24DRAFT_425255 [Aaosphaeria arxii CBS 175.79]KAF2012620.1 hypothetical protein BU24DRAFT_425255 [Aaosphaeria arxii CBS 175.79]